MTQEQKNAVHRLLVAGALYVREALKPSDSNPEVASERITARAAEVMEALDGCESAFDE